MLFVRGDIGDCTNYLSKLFTVEVDNVGLATLLLKLFTSLYFSLLDRSLTLTLLLVEVFTYLCENVLLPSGDVGSSSSMLCILPYGLYIFMLNLLLVVSSLVICKMFLLRLVLLLLLLNLRGSRWLLVKLLPIIAFCYSSLLYFSFSCYYCYKLLLQLSSTDMTSTALLLIFASALVVVVVALVLAFYTFYGECGARKRFCFCWRSRLCCSCYA